MPHHADGNVRIYYDETGEGPALVLLAGWTLNTRFWDWVRPAFAERYRTVALDPRNTGRSTSDPALETSRLADAEDLERLLDALGLHVVHLVGHSKGARIALTFAMTRPERVRSVVSVGSAEPRLRDALDGRVREWVEAARRQARFEGVDEAVRSLKDWNLLGRIHAGPEALALLKRAREGYDGSDLLSVTPRRTLDAEALAPSLNIPVLLIAGEDDPFLAECRHAKNLLPGGRIEVFERCGHFPPIERPSLFAETVLAFLEEAAG